MPGWVKVFAVIGLILVVLLIVGWSWVATTAPDATSAATPRLQTSAGRRTPGASQRPRRAVMFGPRVRKLTLTAHVGCSVGWLGAVVAFLAVAVAALATEEAQTVRAVYVAMEVVGWFVLVPLSVAALATGVVQSLGTTCALLRHYWVVVKLAMTVLATAVLLLYTQTLGTLADAAQEPSSSSAAVLPSASAVLHAGAALVLVVVATVLAGFKPPGMTRYGRSRASRRAA